MREAGTYRLAEDLSELRAVHGWLELLMEGYRDLFKGVGRLMREGDGSIERNHLRVATGSARIAIYDAVPLTLRLIERLGASEGVVLDYGCGSALYLITLCAQHPGLRAIGVELAQETVQAAREHVREAGMEDRIAIEHASAPDYVPSEEVDFVVSAFVLHEIVGQRGIEGTVEFLRSFGTRFPSAKLLIIEVSNPYEEGRGELVGTTARGGATTTTTSGCTRSPPNACSRTHSGWSCSRRPAIGSARRARRTTSSTPRAWRSATRWSGSDYFVK